MAQACETSNKNQDKEQSVQEMFHQLQNEIDSCNAEILNLTELRRTIELYQKDQIFDDEDILWANQHIEQYEKQRDIAQQDLEHKQKLYQDTVVSLEKTLKLRQKLLEDLDVKHNVLKNHPILMKQYVLKQVNLTQLLEQTKQKLFSNVL